MSKCIDRTRFNTKPPKVSGTVLLIFRGVMVSLIVALVCTLFLSVISLVTDNTYVDYYIQYINIIKHFCCRDF